MSVELLTVEEFKAFRQYMDMKLDAITDLVKNASIRKKWIKSSEVMKMLSISHGTLQSLRNSGELSLNEQNYVKFCSPICSLKF